MAYTFRLHSQIQFGKYKGKIVSWVVENDPMYLKWIYENLKWMRIKQDVRKELKEKHNINLNHGKINRRKE